ncbi:ABC transporter permease subunit [Mesomycoplasma hyopneumoniae]|uniref:ABC transporter permease n=1 Tax=Mesomycoplasma hyopneumoniae TaxID=2099 RepID=UPI003857E0CE
MVKVCSRLKKEHHFEFVDSLDFFSREAKIAEIRSYYKKRIEFNQEKLDTAIYAWHDDFFNLKVSTDDRKDFIEKKAQKQIRLAQKALENLENQYLNLALDQASFESQKIHLQKQIDQQIKEIKTKAEAKKRKADEFLEKQRVKYEKEIAKKEALHKNFMDYIHQDSKNQINKISKQFQQIVETDPSFFSSRQEKLAQDLRVLNRHTKAKLETLETDFSLRKIGKNTFLDQKKNIELSYLKEVKMLQKQAQMVHPKMRMATKIWNFLKFREQDRFINNVERAKKSLNNTKLLILFLIIAFITGALNVNFFSSYNWFVAILKNNIFIGFIALGQTLVILTGGIDLSVGSLIGFGATIYLLLTVKLGLHFVAVLFILIIILAAIGILNGILISKFKIPPFIVTLAGLLSLRGAIAILLKGTPITNAQDPIFNFFNYNLGSNFSVLVLVFIITVAVLIFFIKFSKFGRYVYAVGDNPVAATFSGIKNNKILILVYMFSGIFAILGALSISSGTTSVSPNTGYGFELDTVTAVVLGGTALTGGKGGVGKTIIGWFAMALLLNTFSFFQLDSNFQLVAKGIIIVLAILFDQKYHINERLSKLYYKVLVKI